MNAMLNFARPESQLAFSSQEQEAYFAANEVNEAEFLSQFNNIACCGILNDDKTVFHYSDVSSTGVYKHYKTGQKYIIVDRRQLGSKSSRRFQLQTADNEQKIIGLFRSLKDVFNFKVEHGII